jgi:hypothetical protein
MKHCPLLLFPTYAPELLVKQEKCTACTIFFEQTHTTKKISKLSSIPSVNYHRFVFKCPSCYFKSRFAHTLENKHLDKNVILLQWTLFGQSATRKLSLYSVFQKSLYLHHQGVNEISIKTNHCIYTRNSYPIFIMSYLSTHHSGGSGQHCLIMTGV